MAIEVRLPQLTDTMESGTIVQWHKQEGDEVDRGDVLAEVETDKATMDIEAFDRGVLLKKLVSEGEELPTQTLIAVIGEEGEDISDLLEEAEKESREVPDSGEEEAEQTEEAEEPRKEEPEPEEETPAEPAPASAQTAESEQPEPEQPEPEPAEPPEPETSVREKTPTDTGESETDGRLRVSPVAQRMAAENGIDLRALEGSGPEGRIVKKDVERAIEQGAARMGAGSEALSGLTRTPSLKAESRDLSRMRSVIAKRMTEAKQDVPHFYLEKEIDMQRVVDIRSEFNEQHDQVDLSYNDFVMKATVLALCEIPQLNAAFQGDSIQFHDHVHLAYAVALEDGLITPIIRKAESKSIVAIHEESKELTSRAREGDLKPDEYQGGTFTVSNLGMFGIDNFSAIINPPQAGILAVGSVNEKPVAVDGELTIRPRMKVTLSCDHRTTDGAQGARFLQQFQTFIEHPLSLLA